MIAKLSEEQSDLIPRVKNRLLRRDLVAGHSGPSLEIAADQPVDAKVMLFRELA